MGLPAKKEDRGYTYGDYRRWPEEERWEFIHGFAWNMCAAPSSFHQRVSMLLSGAFFSYLESTSCEVFAAPFDVLLPDRDTQEEDGVINVVQPDITVICDPEKITPRGCYGSPDLVVEILSPYTAKKDLNEKVELYQEHGIREYWVGDKGNRYVHVYALEDNGRYGEPEIYVYDDIVKSVLLKDFTIPLEELFRTPNR